jgi:hypothetical protein
MNKNIQILIVILSIFFSLSVKGSDTVHVITHNKETVVTDPSRGVNEYRRWGVFPPVGTSIRKIVLHVRFACPDTMRCADWDYLDFISIKRRGGVSGENKDFEIARMLTPYGGAFNKDWKFSWELDITDFSLLLRDSVEIEYNLTGSEPNKDRGWKITHDFEIIKGKPVAEPISIRKVYGGGYKYGDSATSIETFLKPFNFTKEGESDFAKFRIYQTGHGANRGDACGEFCSKWREIVFNGQSIDKRTMWKECGDNPLYPQAGTWIYDRANWCPGDLQVPDEYLLPLQSQNTIDVNMEPYVAKPSEAVENIAAYIIQYKKAETKNDVSILDIAVPSNKGTHLRSNPACANAKILVKNNGKNEVKSLQIVYNTVGFKAKQYNWKGKLSFNQQTEIELPGMIEGNEKENTFIVTLSKPNGKTDDFSTDNSMASRFTKAPAHGKELVLALKTNNQPQHNSYVLQNSQGKTIYRRQFDSTEKNQLFRDTFKLTPGCYELLVNDSADNGLEFWANPRAGRGFVRLQDVSGNLLKQFDSDFGKNIFYSFIVTDDKQQWSEVNTETAIGLYPTRTNDKTTRDFFSGGEEEVLVQLVTDPGDQIVEEHKYARLREGMFTYDLSRFPKGRFYLKVFVNGAERFKKRIRLKE